MGEVGGFLLTVKKMEPLGEKDGCLFLFFVRFFSVGRSFDCFSSSISQYFGPCNFFIIFMIPARVNDTCA